VIFVTTRHPEKCLTRCFLRSDHQNDARVQVSADLLDAMYHDVIDYLEGVYDLEKARPPNDGTRTKTTRPTASAPPSPSATSRTSSTPSPPPARSRPWSSPRTCPSRWTSSSPRGGSSTTSRPA